MAAPLRQALTAAVKKLDTTLWQSRRALHVSGGRCEQWQLYSAVCVERYPTITKEVTSDVAKRYAKLIDQTELENSFLSKHELRHQEDLKKAAQRKLENIKDASVEQTAVEFEDQMEVALQTFAPASKRTDADKDNDLKTAERKLDRKLFLLVKQRLGDKDYWCFPQGRWAEGQSMRESAERTLSELCGNVPVVFVGNAPCGFLKYQYPAKAQSSENCDGAKVFFYKAVLKEGVNGVLNPPSKDVSDYMWLTKEELRSYIASTKFQRTVKNFLVEI